MVLRRRSAGVLLAAAVLPGIAGVVLEARSETGGEDQAATVRLVIDYDDGVEKHFTRLPWTEGMTVLEGLKRASKIPHGIELEYKDHGGGMGVMITRIDDLENQRGGTNAKNWIYKVNGQMAKVSCDKRELEAGDLVHWVFDDWTP